MGGGDPPGRLTNWPNCLGQLILVRPLQSAAGTHTLGATSLKLEKFRRRVKEHLSPWLKQAHNDRTSYIQREPVTNTYRVDQLHLVWTNYIKNEQARSGVNQLHLQLCGLVTTRVEQLQYIQIEPATSRVNQLHLRLFFC